MKIASQLILFFFSIFLILEGLWGSSFAPKNLTTLFVWVHYRGLLVLILLLAGNYFCMSCPFIFFRNILRLFISPKKIYPKILANKWPALALFIGLLFSYEYFAFWAHPQITALLILAYFGIAILIDLNYKNANFCKYLCPIGQFNFISSTLSPKEVQLKNMSVCESCTTYECLKGSVDHNGHQRGCETQLFIPKKNGNLDCTFCMDCIAACPYGNVAVMNVTPASELLSDKHRAGIGTLSEKKDYLAFIVVFTFGGLLNAFMMVDSRSKFTKFLTKTFSLHNEFLLCASLFFLVLLPIIYLTINAKKKNRELIPTLIPLGFSIWFAHYSFHFLTGIFTFIPLVFHTSIPISWMGLPLSIVTPMQFGFLFLGFTASLLLVIKKMADKKQQSYLWFFIHTTIFFLAIWVMSRPMDMRGTFLGGAP